MSVLAWAGDTLPPWGGMDIGSPLPAGGAQAADGTFTLIGGGSGLFRNSDQFHWAYQSVTGDFSLVAHLASETGSSEDAQAGIMVRDALAATSHFVAVVSMPSHGDDAVYRTSCFPQMQTHALGVMSPALTWLKLVKRGTTVTGYAAIDQNGSPGPWQLANQSQTIGTGMVYAGLCVSSHDPGVVCTAVFDHVTLSVGPPPLDDGVYVLAPVSAPELALSGTSGGVGLVAPVRPWRFTHVVGNLYAIHPATDPAQSLAVTGGGMADGTRLTLTAEQNVPAERWAVVPQPDGSYVLAPQCAPGSGLDDFAGSTTPQAVVDIWQRMNGDPHTQWTITPPGTVSTGTPPTHYEDGPDSLPQPGVPQGQTLQFNLTASPRYYPGTVCTVWVYVPAEYTPAHPACLCVGLDGPVFRPQTVFDNLIFHKQMPITIGVFLSAGAVNKPGTNQPIRYDRSYEFDSVNRNMDRFLTREVLPAVERLKTADGRPIRISADPNDHMIYGASSGGVCAFTAAWQRPDLFRRVFTAIGTYVGMRGADQYPTLVRKTEPKPIRLFLQDGNQDAWNPLFDSWWTQNQSLEQSLRFAGYDVNHSWGTLGHDGSQGESVFPDAVKWLWRDYPQPISAGVSQNSMLHTILVPGTSWTLVAGTSQRPYALAASPTGDVYFTEGAAGTVAHVAPEGDTASIVRHEASRITAQAFGPDGRLYAALADGQIIAVGPHGQTTVIAHGISARALCISSDSRIYATVPGAHNDLPSKVWLIRPGGTKIVVDRGLREATGLVLTPDHSLLFVAEGRTHWIYSYVVQPNGTLGDKQRFYWLHTAESADDAGDGSAATDLAEDAQGNLYVATRMGVQVCDRNGRVEGILTLPPGRVTSLCFGGAGFRALYVVCGGCLYRRVMQVSGIPGWAKPTPLPPFSAG